MTKCSIPVIIFLSLKEKLPQAFMQIGWMDVALSCGTLLQFVMSQQYNCLMLLYTNFTFHENISSLYLMYVRAKTIVHA